MSSSPLRAKALPESIKGIAAGLSDMESVVFVRVVGDKLDIPPLTKVEHDSW